MTDNGVSKVIDMDKTTVKRARKGRRASISYTSYKILGGAIRLWITWDEDYDNTVSYEAELLNTNLRALTLA